MLKALKPGIYIQSFRVAFEFEIQNIRSLNTDEEGKRGKDSPSMFGDEKEAIAVSKPLVLPMVMKIHHWVEALTNGSCRTSIKS